MDVEAVKALGIAVTNTPGTLAESVAELTIGLLLDGVRKITASILDPEGDPPKTRELSSMRVGIVGLGAIGSAIARILSQGFRCEAAYYSRTRKREAEAALDIQYMDLDSLAAWSEAFVIMPIANKSTLGLIDSRVVGALPNGAVLVNSSKPVVVDSSALLAGLKSGKIATACFDGFYEADDPSFKELAGFRNDRLLVTKHLGSLTYEARDRMGSMAVKNLIDYLAKGTGEHVVVAGSR
jgi:gluconate 2-dehydrogenase